jgi:hypothetical protein
MTKKMSGGKMKHNGNFTQDLKFSQEAEEYTVNKLKEKWPKTKRVEGNFKGYDIVIPEEDWKIEVKLDRKTLITDNLFIEYESRKHPSGITISYPLKFPSTLLVFGHFSFNLFTVYSSASCENFKSCVKFPLCFILPPLVNPYK